MIEKPGDVDWIKVTLQQNTRYRIDLEGSWTEHGPWFPPQVRGIFDAKGDPVGGSWDGRQVVFTPSETAAYFVAAGGRPGYGDYGAYTLSVAEQDDDFTSDTGTAGRLVVGGDAVSGEIQYRGDRDWFEVTLVDEQVLPL